MISEALTETITAFLHGVGIEVVAGSVDGGAFLPGIMTRDGRLVVDTERLEYPGDLLHEAGHLAVLEPGERRRFGTPGGGDGDDMSRVEQRAIAWSYAAVAHLGLDPGVVFHDGGYRGHGRALRAGFAVGVFPGVAALEEIGMTHFPPRAAELGVDPYPHMVCWVRG